MENITFNNSSTTTTSASYINSGNVEIGDDPIVFSLIIVSGIVAFCILFTIIATKNSVNHIHMPFETVRRMQLCNMFFIFSVCLFKFVSEYFTIYN